MSDTNWTAYYMITVNDSGDIRVYERSHDDALAMLQIDDDGELKMAPYVVGEPWDSDPSYWIGNGRPRCLIIKGEIVTPRPVTVKYELA